MSKEQKIRNELVEIDSKLQGPKIFSSPNYPALAKKQAQLQKIVNLFDAIAKYQKALDETAEIVANETDAELLEMAREEKQATARKIESLQQELDELLSPSDPNNERDAIVEIRGAAGGDESSLFAGELFRMYSKYAEKQGLKVELISESPGVVGGFKEIIFAVRGENAYKQLKFEAGVHRVQRVPATESSGRIHTSTVTVAVLPEAEESDIEIKPDDLRVDVFRSSGHGGQSVNTTDSAVRITHLPTGIVVTCQDEKSQIKNKLKAMGVLRSRLLAAKIEAEQEKLSSERRKLIGSGDRSEKIRTYNFPQDRITDHRIGYSRSNIPVALAGEIDDLVEKLATKEKELIQASK